MKKTKQLFVSEEKEGSEPLEDIDDKEILEIEISRLKVILEKIPTEDKAVLLMKYKEELSIKEIGEVLNKSESAVKMKIKRAKAKVQKVYKQEFNHR